VRTFVEPVEARAFYDVFINHAEISYARTQNPLYAVYVWRFAVRVGEPPPAWTVAVVLRAVDGLLAERAGDNAAILTALGLRTPPRGRGFPTQYRHDQEVVAAALLPRRDNTEAKRAQRGRLLLDAVRASYPKPRKPI